jgi:hypothetical protein
MIHTPLDLSAELQISSITLDKREIANDSSFAAGRLQPCRKTLSSPLKSQLQQNKERKGI